MMCPPHPDAPTEPGCAAGSVGSPGRMERTRPRGKPEHDDKLKKPLDGERKKSPPVRKAPSRGRYVDEYARPAG